MSAELLQKIEHYLTTLETVQEDLFAACSETRHALTHPQNESLLQVAERETQTAQRLQILIRQRQQLLEEGRQLGCSADTLHALVHQLPGADLDVLTPRLERASEAAAHLRHESWVHWIIAHRSCNHFTEMLDLIANHGERAATYQDRPAPTVGGALLDASI